MLSTWNSLISKLARFVDDFVRTARLNYTLAERLNLVAARLSRGDRTRVLWFRVRHLNRASFRIALREIFFEGDYRFEPKTDSPLIFDCGANIGLATLYFKHLYPKARIVAFEADPATAAVLRENVVSNHLEGVTIHNLMLAGGEGEFAFYSGGEANLMGSANPSRVAQGREIKVSGTRLSLFVDGEVDLLKLDVEGSESDVLADLNASKKLSKVRQMVIEYHHKIGGAKSRLAEFLKLLEENGFEYQLASMGCDPITQ